MDRTKKNYFEDESNAVVVRDKATDADDKAKGRKKDVISFFQSTATLKRHAGKLSAKQEELDIRSEHFCYHYDNNGVNQDQPKLGQLL